MALFDRSMFRPVEGTFEKTILSAEGLNPAFVVTGRILTAPQQQKLFQKVSRQGPGGLPTIDNKKIGLEWARLVLVDWTGLTWGNLRRLSIEIDKAKFEQEFPGGDIPFSNEMGAMLYDYTYADDFVTPIREAMDEMREQLKHGENEEEEKARKNS